MTFLACLFIFILFTPELWLPTIGIVFAIWLLIVAPWVYVILFCIVIICACCIDTSKIDTSNNSTAYKSSSQNYSNRSNAYWTNRKAFRYAMRRARRR
jgi:fatty acid desaturase